MNFLYPILDLNLKMYTLQYLRPESQNVEPYFRLCELHVGILATNKIYS